ncbi:MAG: outer membrane lipoprotein-sorting protein [Acidobacteria bacterium]|nr:outer membrane lipoprotein-sorting protein [Acidobacteriota bacterium]
MSRLVFFLLITLFLNTWAGNERFLHATTQVQGRSPQERGTSVARQVQDRESGRDNRTAMRMRLFDRQGRMRERALTILGMKGGAGRPVPGDRSLTRFTYPNDINGTGFLVWENPDAEDERFLYLPSLGRVRRIAGNETQDSFVGSDFTYEDIGGREFNDYTYTRLDDTSRWTAPDGSTHAVYRLESKNKDVKARFPRVISLVRQDNFVFVRGEIHNRRDELQKVFDVRKLERVSGIWTVMEMVMADTLQKTRTELVVEKIEYNVGLTAADFSRRELERGGR